MTVSPDGQLLAYTADETGLPPVHAAREGPAHAASSLRTTAERVTSVEWTEDGKTLLYSVEHRRPSGRTRCSGIPWAPPATTSCCEEKDERFSVGVWKSPRPQVPVRRRAAASPRPRPATFPPTPASAEMKVIAAARARARVRRRPSRRHVLDPHQRQGPQLPPGDGSRRRTLTQELAGGACRTATTSCSSGHLLFRDFYVLVEREGGWPQIRVTDFRSGQSHRIAFPEPAYQVEPVEQPRVRRRRSSASPTSRRSPRPRSTTTTPSPASARSSSRSPCSEGSTRRAIASRPRRPAAADGVEVPMWLVHRKDLKLDGTNPALLYAYGSYGASMSAGFSSNRVQPGRPRCRVRDRLHPRRRRAGKEVARRGPHARPRRTRSRTSSPPPSTSWPRSTRARTASPSWAAARAGS